MPNFPLTEKCFLLTNFSNGKQTQESWESDFPETTFQTFMCLFAIRKVGQQKTLSSQTKI